MAAEVRASQAHIRFCLKMYRIQIKAKRYFVLEHPEQSRAWQMPEVVEFLLQFEVDSTVLHMCAFGMTAIDEKREALVQKATRVMSSSDEVLKTISVRCNSETCASGQRHRRAHLIQGRAKAPRVYP